MGGLIGGEGWNSASEAYANAHNPVDLLDLANHYGHETRLLVALAEREVRAEYSQRGQR